MDKMIADLSAYFAVNGSLADLVTFTQAVADGSYQTIAHLWTVIQGSV
jgi:hypothetical protein